MNSKAFWCCCREYSVVPIIDDKLFITESLSNQNRVAASWNVVKYASLRPQSFVITTMEAGLDGSTYPKHFFLIATAYKCRGEACFIPA